VRAGLLRAQGFLRREGRGDLHLGRRSEAGREERERGRTIERIISEHEVENRRGCELELVQGLIFDFWIRVAELSSGRGLVCRERVEADQRHVCSMREWGAQSTNLMGLTSSRSVP